MRPTGLLDPKIEILPSKNQIDDLIGKINSKIKNKERTLVTTLTKRMAEELSEYLIEMGIKTHYLHSEIDTLERVEILRDLRYGVYDVVVGINLLREGIDLPEVSLVAIIDADKECYLRSSTSLIQTIGSAARHINGEVIMYADKITKSMKYAIDETNKRRKLQSNFNKFLRIKANLYSNQGKKIKHRKHHDWTDANNKPDKDVKICILNFTSCNGGTVIKEKEVQSKENQMIFFNNTDEHFGITQDDVDSRILLNIVYR